MSLPPHFIDEKNKEVVFYIKGAHSVTIAIQIFRSGIKKLKMQTHASHHNWVDYLRETPTGRAKARYQLLKNQCKWL